MSVNNLSKDDVLSKSCDHSDFDADRTLELDPDARQRANEYDQAFSFRKWIFYGVSIFTLVLAMVWLYLMLFSWPDPHDLPTGLSEDFLFKLILIKALRVSLLAVILLSFVIALLRFAIRFGHHNSHQKETPGSDTLVTMPFDLCAKLIKHNPSDI